METLSATAFADKVIMARERARKEHERIFGKKPKTFRELGMMDNISSRRFVGHGDATVTMKKQTVKAKRRGKKAKKTLCPHCATKNFKQVAHLTFRCTKCRYET